VIESTFEQSYSENSRIASVRAARIVSRYRLPYDSFPDLVQECLLELWRKRLAYDPRRGSWPTFTESIVANRLATLMRHKNARCRRRLIEVDMDSLSDCLPTPDGRIELRTDVRRVLSRVAPFDRAVALSLAECPAAETASRLCVGRATVYRAIGRLRAEFISAGIEVSEC